MKMNIESLLENIQLCFMPAKMILFNQICVKQILQND